MVCAIIGSTVLPLVSRQRIEVFKIFNKVEIGNELELFRLRERSFAVGGIIVGSDKVTTVSGSDVIRFGHDVDLLMKKCGA